MNGIEELADRIVGLRTDGVASAIMAKLRLHVADTIGAWIAATQTPEGKALISFRHRLPIGHAVERNLHDDLATHCALVRLSEIDDIHLASMTTPGSIAIPAAVTLAANLHETDIDSVAAAMLAGYEAMIGLGLVIKGPNVLYRGIWPTYFAAGFATAAVTARLLRLNLEQTAHALALALTLASPSVGQHHAVTTARWFSVGNAARNGLTAALGAQSGFTADLDILRSRLFPEVYGIEPDIAVMVGNTALAFSEVSVKPWCAARQTMAATQALREILESGVRAAEIAEITAYVLPPHLRMINHGITLGDRASFLTSLPYQLAIVALQPSHMADLNLAAEVPLSSLHGFMGRVKVAAEDALLADYPARWPARIVVEASSGRRELRIDCVPGDPERPLTKAEIEKKFSHFAEPLASDTAAKLLQSSLNALNSNNSLFSLMKDLEGVMSRAAR